jgi:tetratricopeptide (TPR) repeat protein
VRRTLGIVVAISLAAVAGIALFGRGERTGAEATPSGQFAQVATPPRDIARLVDQFSVAPTPNVVERLELEARGPKASPMTFALLGLGYQQLFRESGDPTWLSRAGVALGKGRDGAPSEPIAVTGLAQLAVTQHRFNDGATLARAALRLDSTSGAARGALGDALFNLGRYDEAYAEYDRLAAAGPSVAAYARVAFARQLEGRRLAAIDAMELALEAGSGIPEQEAWAQVQYGNMLLGVGRVTAAEDAYRTARALAPGYVHATAGLARVDAARGRYVRSASRLRAVIERLPAPQYAILLTDVLRKAGRSREAAREDRLVDALERLLAANGVRTELSTAIHDLDRGVRVGDALKRARAAYATAPSVGAADAIAWGLYRTGHCREARAWASKAGRRGTQDALFSFHRAMIERCLGNDDAARSGFRQALRIDPNFSYRWNGVATRYAS